MHDGHDRPVAEANWSATLVIGQRFSGYETNGKPGTKCRVSLKYRLMTVAWVLSTARPNGATIAHASWETAITAMAAMLISVACQSPADSIWRCMCSGAAICPSQRVLAARRPALAGDASKQLSGGTGRYGFQWSAVHLSPSMLYHVLGAICFG